MDERKAYVQSLIEQGITDRDILKQKLLEWDAEQVKEKPKASTITSKAISGVRASAGTITKKASDTKISDEQRVNVNGDNEISTVKDEAFNFPQTQTETEFEELIKPVTNENKVKEHLEKSDGRDISFTEFDNVAEEDLIETLETKYPWLEFDQPFVYKSTLGGGANRDVIQITNPKTYKTQDFDLGTDFNRRKWGDESTPSSKTAYNSMLEFITEQRPTGGAAIRTLGDDYMTERGPLQVTPEITQLALKKVKEDETGITTMESAINDIVDTEFGEMNIAWRTDLYNKEVFETTKLNNKITDLVINEGADFRFTNADLDDAASFNKNRDILESLGVPKEVFKTDRDRDFLQASVRLGESANPAAQLFYDKINRQRNSLIKEQVEEYLNGSQEFGENKLGKKIDDAYKAATQKREEEDKINKAQSSAKEQITPDNKQVIALSETYQKNGIAKETADNQALTDVINSTTTEIINTETNKSGEDLILAEHENWRMSDKNWDALKTEQAAIWKETDPIKKQQLIDAYLEKVRVLVKDDEINLLRSGDDVFIDPSLETQNVEAKRRQAEIGEELEKWMYVADDELTQELFNKNNKIKSVVREIVQQGYGETMLETTVAQQIGEGLSHLIGAVTLSKGVFARDGIGTEIDDASAYNDFKKLENWINEGGEMPLDLTTLPESSGASDLIKEYNDLLESRSTLLLAKELNINPLTYSKANTGMGRFFNAFGAGTITSLGGRFSGEQQAKEHTIEILKDAFGFEFTQHQERMMTKLDGYEKAGEISAGLAVMAGEMALTYPLLGGAANLSKSIFAGAEWMLGRTGLSKGTQLALSKYTAGVGTEYVGLLGSNIMEEQIFNREGIKNPLLFAAGAGGARYMFGGLGNKFNDAIKITASKPGNEKFLNSLAWVSNKQPLAANVNGALKFAQAGTRNLIAKPTLLAAEALTGAVGIKAGEGIGGLWDVAFHDKAMAELWDEITDPESLFETAGALLFMKASRPDQYVKKAVEEFYAEADMLAGNNPAWNRLRAALGMERLLGKKAKSAYQDPNYIFDLQEAYAKKIKEISNGEGDYKGLDKKGRDDAYDLLNFNFNRLKLKPALDQIVADYKKQETGEYTELELASLNVSKGGYTAWNLLKIAAAARTSPGGSSPILQLMANGFTEVQAKNIVDFSETLYKDGMELFGGNVGSKNFENYTNEIIKQNSIRNQLKEIDQLYKNKKLTKTNYDEKVSALDRELKISEKNAKEQLELEKIERAEEEIVDIQKLKDEGLNVIEGNDASIKKYMDDHDFNFSKTKYGYQGIDPATGKGIALVNVEATARDMKRATATHEVWHFPFERKMGDRAIANRAEELMKKDHTLSEEKAVEKADQEARKYIDNFNKGLKERGIFETVASEMAQRGGYLEAVWNKVTTGEKVPMSEMKEFLNEFIQLDKAGAFDMMKSEAQVKSSSSQAKKNLTETEYSKSLKDPKAFVDFVLSGKYKSKNINEFLKKEQDLYTKEFAGEKEAKMQPSEKIENIKSVGKDAEIISAEQVEKIISRVAGAAWNKYGSRIPKNIAEAAGLTRKSYVESAKAELYKPTKGPQWIKKWDGTRQPFNQYVANKGMLELKTLATELGVESKDAPTKKRISDKVTAEGEREFDIASEDLTPEESMIAKEGRKSDTEGRKEDRQISTFEGKEAKAKEKEILEIFEDIPSTELISRSKKGLAGTPKEDLGKVGELLFDIPGSKITDGTKNLTYAKKIVNIETGKPVKKGEKGVPEPSEMGNIQKYFSDVVNLERALKTLPPENITGSESIINKQGEIIDVSRDVKGKGLKLPKRFLDYFYEKTGKRSQGLTSQPAVWKLKNKFINPKPETLKQIQKDLLIGGNFKLYERTKHGQLAKGLALVESMKVANEATRKDLPAETKAEKQLIADLKAGASKFQASERMTQKKRMTQAMGEYDFYNTKQVKKARKVILEEYGSIFGPILINRMFRDLTPSGSRGEKIVGLQMALDPLGLKTQRLKRPLTKKEIAQEADYINQNETLLANDLILNIKELKAEIKKQGLQNNPAAIKIMEAFGTSQKLNKLASNLAKTTIKGEVVDNLKNRKEATKLLIDKFKEAYDADPSASAILREFIYNNKASGMLGKDAALMRGKIKNAEKAKSVYEEHTYPFSSWAIRTMDAIASKNPKVLEGWKEWAAENYYQIAFDLTTKAPGLKLNYREAVDQTFKRVDGKGEFKSQSGEHPLLEKALDEAFKTGDFSNVPASEIRFFNEYVHLNPNKLMLDGETFAKKWNVEVDKKFENDPDIIAEQSKLIYEQIIGKIDAKEARERIEFAKKGALEKAKARKTDLKILKEPGVLNLSERMSTNDLINKANEIDKALDNARKIEKPIKKARVFDFDDTVARTKSKVIIERDGVKKKITAEEFAKEGERMIEEGWEMDFSEFNKIIKGKKGPLFELMKRMNEAEGKRDMFILTARSPESAFAIKEFLKELGVDIPLENIIGLGSSTGKSKADWLVGKAAEGYNDFYFADDAPQNVKAVRDALEVIDVKSKVQQARMNASERYNKIFNEILEEKTGIGKEKVFSDVKAGIRGKGARRQKFFIPPSAEDFLGLLYATLPKGVKGDKALKFYKESLLDPYSRAMENLSTDRINLMQDFKKLKKELNIPKDLKKRTKSGFTNEQAVRVHLWTKEGIDISGLSKKDLKELSDIIENNPKLKAFSEQLEMILKGDKYHAPTKNWLSGTITTDLINVLNTAKRAKYLEEWKENKDIIFSKQNMNKLEAAFGKKYREALENMLRRMESGTNRTSTGNRLSDGVLDYINGAQGAIMFLNMRSAVLQTISAANFINLSFNNPLKAGKAFANQKQYWKDFMELMNSDYLVDRRNGLKINISESEIANAAKGSTNKAKAAINYILEKGYLPTKFADSFAIASGGATWYRNKINDLIKKEGLSPAEAKEKAFKEFRDISEKSQQSSDPSKISQQQSSDLGRVVLQFVNTPMQYARMQKRAVQDLRHGRGSWKANMSKVLYYGVMQNLWFNGMQQGLFALGFGDNEIDEKEEEKLYDTANGMLDSMLRGVGMAGMTVSVIKNLLRDVYIRSGEKRPEYKDAWQKLLEFSPAIKSKFGKLKSAAWPFDSKKRRAEVFDKGFSLDNPAYESAAKVVSAVTNIPLDRLWSKYNNLQAAAREDQETWRSVALFLGWPEWQLQEKQEESEENKYNNIKSYSKQEQIDVLKQHGYSDNKISEFKKEDDRVNAILNAQEKSSKVYKPKELPWIEVKQLEVKEQRKKKKKEIYDLSKKEQIRILKNLGVTDNEIKELRIEGNRVNKILNMRNKDSKKVDKAITDQASYKPSKEEQKKIEIFDLNKGEQVDILKGYDLSDADIRALKYEQDRVDKILELQED
jgi:hypothetical protein